MDQRLKNIFSIIALTIIVYGIVANNFGYWPFSVSDQRPAAGDQEDQVCAQVITPAKNPETGAIVEFPTPCDVPEGWEIVRPERLPGSDINE